MRASIRPYITTGVALVGASLIAVTPIQPAATLDVKVASPAVQLAAAPHPSDPVPSPLELYPQVLGRALANAGALTEAYFADPFPIISATITNQLAYLSAAIAALAEGDISEFFAKTGAALIQPIVSLGAASSGVVSFIAQPYVPNVLFTAAIAPVLNGFAAAWIAVQRVINAAGTLDLIGLVNAVVNIPARIIDGVLNGGYWSSDLFGSTGGLLTPFDDEDLIAGPLAFLIQIDQVAGESIPPASSDTSATEEEQSTTGPGPAMVAAVGDPSADQESADADAEIPPFQDQQAIDTVAAEATDDILTDIDISIDDEVHSEKGLPVVELADDELGDEEELVEAIEVAVGEDAAEKVAEEPESPARPAEVGTADLTAGTSEGSTVNQDASTSTER